jgi:hypothetical protein
MAVMALLLACALPQTTAASAVVVLVVTVAEAAVVTLAVPEDQTTSVDADTLVEWVVALSIQATSYSLKTECAAAMELL